MYIQCIYGIVGREITKYTVIYGEYIRFWPTLLNFLDRGCSFTVCLANAIRFQEALRGLPHSAISTKNMLATMTQAPPRRTSQDLESPATTHLTCPRKPHHDAPHKS